MSSIIGGVVLARLPTLGDVIIDQLELERVPLMKLPLQQPIKRDF
ncbi:hypothetical protein [Microbacterium luticocti]|nr:hypothetical protein [Microbacterium luticocti]